MSVYHGLDEGTIADTDPLAILTEAGVDVFDMSAEVRAVMSELSPEEARVLATVNSRLNEVTSCNQRDAGGINH